MDEIQRLQAKGITPIGRVNHQDDNRLFGIKDKDRLGHIYVIGKTGVGKSTLLLNMAISDAQRGNGFAIIDPHGDLSDEIMLHVPKNRLRDVIFFDPIDTLHPIGFNPLQSVKSEFHSLIASGLISTFKKMWIESWGPRMEHILRFTILTLLEYSGATLLDIQPLLTDKEFRKEVLNHSQNPTIQAFWQNEFDRFSPKMQAEMVSPIINKTSLFLTSIPLRSIVGQKESSFKMQQVMDSGRIFIAKLSKGLLGEDVTTLIGSMLVTFIQLSAMNRASLPEAARRHFYLYIDEAHSFISLSFADILSEARKYRLGLFITHQYIEQLQEPIRKAIFGNIGTLICFRVGSKDAEFLEKEFLPEFISLDLVSLPRFSIFIKLMIDGTTSRPFSGENVLE